MPHRQHVQAAPQGLPWNDVQGQQGCCKQARISPNRETFRRKSAVFFSIGRSGDTSAVFAPACRRTTARTQEGSVFALRMARRHHTASPPRLQKGKCALLSRLHERPACPKCANSCGSVQRGLLSRSRMMYEKLASQKRIITPIEPSSPRPDNCCFPGMACLAQ